MQSFALRRDQEQYLHSILDRGADLLNIEEEEDIEPATFRPRVGRVNSDLETQDFEETERPQTDLFRLSAAETEQRVQYEDPFFIRKREAELRRFKVKPLEPLVEHASEGLEVEIREVQTRMKMLQAQLQTPGSIVDQRIDPPIFINPPMTLQDLDSPSAVIPIPGSQPLSVHKSIPHSPPLPSDQSDVNDYSVGELERLKWLIMEEKRKQEEFMRENAKFSTRVRFRTDLETKAAEMKEAVDNLQTSVQHSKHLRKRQKALIKVIQFQIDKEEAKQLGEKYPEYFSAIESRKTRGKRRKRVFSPIIQHGRITARRPSI